MIRPARAMLSDRAALYAMRYSRYVMRLIVTWKISVSEQHVTLDVYCVGCRGHGQTAWPPKMIGEPHAEQVGGTVTPLSRPKNFDFDCFPLTLRPMSAGGHFVQT